MSALKQLYTLFQDRSTIKRFFGRNSTLLFTGVVICTSLRTPYRNEYEIKSSKRKKLEASVF